MNNFERWLSGTSNRRTCCNWHVRRNQELTDSDDGWQQTPNIDTEEA